MKNLLLPLLLSSSLFGEILLLHGERRDMKILKEGNRYYLNSIRSLNTEVRDSRTLIVSLKQGVDPLNFGAKYNLELVRSNSTGSYIFKVLSKDIDIVQLSNLLLAKPETISVAPNWKRFRGLK